MAPRTSTKPPRSHNSNLSMFVSAARLPSPNLNVISVPVTLNSEVIRSYAPVVPKFDQPCMCQSIKPPVVILYNFDAETKLISIRVSPERQDLL